MLTPLVSSLTNPIPALVPAAWFRGGYGVTGTLTASNWADQSGNGRDLAQGTAGNQPIYLPYSGTAYGWMPGASGNYYSSNASPAIVNLDVRFQIAANTYPVAADTTIVGQYNATGNQKSWLIDTNNTGAVYLGVSTDGSTYVGNAIGTTPLASGYTGGTAYWFRITRIDSTGALTLYGSTDYDPSNINSGTWTSLGTGTSTSGALFNSTQNVEIGTYQSGTGQMFLGKNFRTQIVSSGALAVDFNPSTFAETSTNGATAVASTGETWTLNSTGAKPAQIVKSASLLGDGTDDFMQAIFTLDQPITYYIVAKGITWTNGDELIEGAIAPGGSGMLQQITGSPQIRAYSGNEVATISPSLGSKFIAGFVVNNTSSIVSLNGVEQTGTAGTRNMGGITLFSDYLGTGNVGNFQAYELIAFSSAHSAAERSRVINWLNYVHHCY